MSRPLLAWAIEQLGTHELEPARLARRLRDIAERVECGAALAEPPWGEARKAAVAAQAEAAAEAAAETERLARLARARALNAQPAVSPRPARPVTGPVAGLGSSSPEQTNGRRPVKATTVLS